MRSFNTTRAARACVGVIGRLSSKIASERCPLARVPTMLEPGDLMPGGDEMGRNRSADIAGRARAEDLHLLPPSPEAMTAISPQMFPEKLRRPPPGEFGRLTVMHGLSLLVDEGVLGIITEQLKRLAGFLHGLLEAVHQLRRAPVVLVGEMGLQRNPDIRRLCRLLRRNAVEHDARGQLRHLGGADDGHRAAEAEA